MALRVPDVKEYNFGVVPKEAEISPMADVGAQTKGLTAEHAMGEELTKAGLTVGGELAINYAKMQKADNDLYASKIASASDIEKMQVLSEQNAKVDGTNREQVTKETLDRFREIDERVTPADNKYVAGLYQKHADSHNVQLFREHAHHANMVAGQVAVSDAKAIAEQITTEAQTSSVTPMEYHLQRYEEAIEQLPLNEAQKQEFKRVGSQQIAGNTFESKVKTDPNFVASLQNEEVKKKWFSMLDPDKRSHYEGILEAADKKRANTQSFIQVLESVSLLPEVKNGQVSQIDKAMSEMGNAPAAMKKYNIATVDQWKSILVDLSAIKTQQHNESVQVMDTVSLDARKLYNQRKLTDTAISDLASKIPDFGVRDNFIKEMTALKEHQVVLAKQIRAMDASTTDPHAYARLHDKVLREGIDPTKMPALQREILSTPGIGENHRNALTDKLYGKLDQATREIETQVKTTMKNQIISSGAFGPPVPAEWANLSKAYDALDKESNAARTSGKPWSQEQYSKYGQQLATFYRFTLGEKTSAQIQDLTRKKTPSLTQGIPTRNAGETIEQYKQRTGRQ